MFLEDSKVDGVSFRVTWFQFVEDGTLVLGSVRDLARYCATSCFYIVDLKLVDGSSNTYLQTQLPEETFLQRGL